LLFHCNNGYAYIARLIIYDLVYIFLGTYHHTQHGGIKAYDFFFFLFFYDAVAHFWAVASLLGFYKDEILQLELPFLHQGFISDMSHVQHSAGVSVPPDSTSHKLCM
jgi:hypothetical protein